MIQHPIEKLMQNSFDACVYANTSVFTLFAVLVQIYLHYLPIRNGRETRKDLGLQGDVRWFTFWKGRGVVMADVTAM